MPKKLGENGRKRDWSFYQHVQRFGLGWAIYRAIMIRIRKQVLVAVINSRELFAEAPEEDPSPFEVRVLDEQALLDACTLFPTELTPAFIKLALARGDVCLGAYDDERLVSFTWRCYSRCHHKPGIWVQVPKGYRYGYKAFTEPSYRGKRAMNPYVSDPICISKGCSRTIAFIELHNRSSIANSDRQGKSKIVGYVAYLKIFGKLFTWHSASVKAVGFKFYAADAEGNPLP